MTTSPDVSDKGLAAPPPEISIRHLDLYYGNFHALIDINADFQGKTITALIGPSGCGKSTLLRVLNRMNDLIDISEVERFPPSKIVIMATGAQGEPSAVLGRLSHGRHRNLSIQEGDTVVFSAHAIPGNEETVHRVINRMFQKGANVVYHPIAPVHVSGHGSREDMRLMLEKAFGMVAENQARALPAKAMLRAIRSVSRTRGPRSTRSPRKTTLRPSGWMLTLPCTASRICPRN